MTTSQRTTVVSQSIRLAARSLLRVTRLICRHQRRSTMVCAWTTGSLFASHAAELTSSGSRRTPDLRDSTKSPQVGTRRSFGV
jgi:hypothetical protein